MTEAIRQTGEHLPLEPAGPEKHLRALVRASGWLADYCEHSEHCQASRHGVSQVGQLLRQTAATIARERGASLRAVYASRIRQVEAGSLLRFTGLDQVELAGADILDQARTWRQLQVGQVAHDRQFHPDVFGLNHYEQLRHYAFHIAKLAWLFADAIDRQQLDGFCEQRLADIALFGVKLATVEGEELPDLPID